MNAEPSPNMAVFDYSEGCIIITAHNVEATEFVITGDVTVVVVLANNGELLDNGALSLIFEDNDSPECQRLQHCSHELVKTVSGSQSPESIHDGVTTVVTIKGVGGEVLAASSGMIEVKPPKTPKFPVLADILGRKRRTGS